MIRRSGYILLACFVSLGAVAAFAAIPPLNTEATDADTTAAAPPIAPEAAKVPSAPRIERAPIGNPLWAIPVRQLSATRERPIFSPSRRPPPSAVVGPVVAPVATRPAPKPAEPERPQLSLVGTIASEIEGIGVFIDQTTKKALRLKIGEGHQGWVLRSVQGREARLQKGGATAIIGLPSPGGKEAGSVQLLAETQPAEAAASAGTVNPFAAVNSNSLPAPASSVRPASFTNPFQLQKR
jgi:hypothetical protein